MGLVINSNLPALNAGNILNKSSKKTQKSMEKLASGFKINRSADDASGLGISEKMRNKITALDTQIDVDEDAINFLNTADGYLSEIQDMIERMTELTMKSANGVLADYPDRENLQKEMDQICGEIDRIASTANFNGIKLFNGNVEKASVITEKRTVNVPEDIPYSNLIKDVNHLSSNQIIFEGDEIETVKFLANTAHKYLDEHNYSPVMLKNMAVFYSEDGEHAMVAHKNADVNAIKTQLGLQSSDNLLKAETSEFDKVIRYGVDIPYRMFVNNDDTGEATSTLIDKALKELKAANNNDLECMKGKKVYYTDDGSKAFVGSNSMSDSDIQKNLLSLMRLIPENSNH